jgi:hypothetical protein
MVVFATIGHTIDGSRCSSSRLLDLHELLVGAWEMIIIKLARPRQQGSSRRRRANYDPRCYLPRILT